MTYQVKLAIFEGPLDLLLHLIERKELDITKVSLSQVTDQYLEYIGFLKEVEVAALAEFLVIAAKLLLIKSQVLLPSPSPVLEREEGDIGDELVYQLIEYKRFKEAAKSLKVREEKGLRAYVRVAPPLERARLLDLGDISLADLVEAMRRALEVHPPVPSVSDMVTPFTITIDDKIALIEEMMVEYNRISFKRLLARSAQLMDVSRLEIIVTLLAILELVKRNRIDVQQEDLFGDIFISARPDARNRGDMPTQPFPPAFPS